MKILHFHKSLGAGGIESMVCNLANEMAKTQNVTVGTIFKPKSDDLFFHKLSSSVKTLDLGKTDDTKKPFKEIIKVFFTIQKGHYDIVHIHGYFYYYIIAIWLLHKKVTFFYTLHSDAFHESPPWDIKLIRIKKAFFIKGWIRAITISPASQESFRQLYGCSSYMIMNGISKPTINTEYPDTIERVSSNTKVFLNAGRVCQAKNQVMLCRVFDRLIKEGYDVQLYIAGCIQDVGIYNEMKPYFSDRIIFLDQRDDVPTLLAKADGMCLSSVYEGLPVVLLESLAVGCIPICTPVGGIVDVVTPSIGILSKCADEDSYTEAMKTFLQIDEDGLKGMSKSCKSAFEKYDIRITASHYLESYEK